MARGNTVYRTCLEFEWCKPLPGVGGVEPLDVDLALVSPTFEDELLLLSVRKKKNSKS